MKICVIIPAYNEAKTIGGLITEIKRLGHEALVVDDGSTDDSVTVIKKIIKNVFTQCFRMDKIKTNKEEMHHPYKHIIIENKTKNLIINKTENLIENQINKTKIIENSF